MKRMFFVAVIALIALVPYAIGLVNVKLSDDEEILHIDSYSSWHHGFYFGPGNRSLWREYDSYRIDGGKLINETREEYIQLIEVPTVKIEKYTKNKIIIQT